MVLESFKSKKDPVRYLLIVLFTAERCWSYAMALKQEVDTEHRKRFHMLRRLAKATMYARILYGLCTGDPNKCDARTKLEAEAYLCYMRGIFNFETEKWRAAASHLGRAQAIYVKLCEAISDEEVKLIYQQRVDELKSTLRFCSFNLGEEKMSLDSFHKESVPDESIVSKLDDLKLTTSEKPPVTHEEVPRMGPIQFPPPDLQKLMCKPLFFDLALNHIELPPLEQEMNSGATRGLTGFVKGLWGGGWKK